MITDERKGELISLAAAVTQTMKTLGCRTPEETEFVVDTIVKAEGYANTVKTIEKKCMEVLKETLFGDEKGLSERVEQLEERVENLCEGERLRED